MSEKEVKEEINPFIGDVKPNWCLGCGNYGLLTATTNALAKLGFKPNEVVFTSGIGCSSNFPHWTSVYGIHSLHGRSLPVAMGVRLTNPTLTVIAVSGDGDTYGIGMGHFIHAARRNLDMTCLVMNNQINGLTTGQYSPTSQLGHITITSPLNGVDEYPINPISLALGAGTSFVARGFSGNRKHLQSIIEKAIQHKGFAFVDVLSPCVTFNRLNTYSWFRERVYELGDDHDTTNICDGLIKAQEWGEKIPIGVFYQIMKPSLKDLDPTLQDRIPVNEPLGFKAQGINIQDILDEFR